MENIFVELLPPWIETGLQPAFYDKESGTVLQQVARMYAKVNELIKSFNDISKDFSDLYNEFIELHDYVDDYFDNLDVQDEINNKLDAMVEAGTLQEIIGEYLNATAIWGFDSVADMKASTNLIEGSFAKTLGYYAKGDGGSGYYKIVTDAVTPDEAFYIALTGNLKAKLIVNSEVNIKALGAKGDDTTNDTAVFAKAVNSGLDIYLPQGTYLVENITLGNRQAMRGENMTKSIIKSTANNSEAHIITLNYNNGIYNILENFSINGNKDNQNLEVDGVYASATNDSHNYINRLQIYNCSGNGIYLNNQNEDRISNCVIRGCNKNGLLMNETADTEVSDTVIYSCLLNGFRVTAGMNRFISCKAFGNGRVTDVANDTAYNARYAGFYDSRGNTYVGCDAQGNYGHGFEFKNTNNLNCHGVRTNVNGFQVDNNGDAAVIVETPIYDGINLDHCRYSTIITTAQSMYSDANKKYQRSALSINDTSGNSDYVNATIDSTNQYQANYINNSAMTHYSITNNGKFETPATNVAFSLNTSGGWDNASSAPIKIKRYGNVVTITGKAYYSTGLTGESTQKVLTITDTSVLPQTDYIILNCTCGTNQWHSNTLVGYARINTTGQLQVMVPASGSELKIFDIQGTWIVPDL